MISTLREGVRVALIAAAVVASSPVMAQQPFYKGKRLAVLVNFAPGGSTDIEGRLFARHIARHLEGAAQRRRAEHGRRRRLQRRQLCRRGRAAGRHHGGLPGRRPPGSSPPSPSASAPICGPTSSSPSSPAPRSTTCARTSPPGMKEPRDIVRATGAHRRRQRRAQRARSSDPSHARHPRRAAPLRHRLSQRPDRAARAAAQRGQLLCRAGVGLSRRGRGAGRSSPAPRSRSMSIRSTTARP